MAFFFFQFSFKPTNTKEMLLAIQIAALHFCGRAETLQSQVQES